VPDEPGRRRVLFETVRRFKGLEREVVILCELPDEGERLDQLLYTALTRATTHLVVIAPPQLASRLLTRR
jgi:DNA helicase IV